MGGTFAYKKLASTHLLESDGICSFSNFSFFTSSAWCHTLNFLSVSSHSLGGYLEKSSLQTSLTFYSNRYNEAIRPYAIGSRLNAIFDIGSHSCLQRSHKWCHRLRHSR